MKSNLIAYRVWVFSMAALFSLTLLNSLTGVPQGTPASPAEKLSVRLGAEVRDRGIRFESAAVYWVDSPTGRSADESNDPLRVES